MFHTVSENLAFYTTTQMQLHLLQIINDDELSSELPKAGLHFQECHVT